jgi:hypothetical protein
MILPITAFSPGGEPDFGAESPDSPQVDVLHDCESAPGPSRYPCISPRIHCYLSWREPSSNSEKEIALINDSPWQLEARWSVVSIRMGCNFARIG